MVEDNHERKSLTFSEAEGLEPVPEPLKLGELSTEARSLIWREVHQSIKDSAEYNDWGPDRLGPKWDLILYDWHVEVLHQPADEFNSELGEAIRKVKYEIYHAQWNILFDFLQFAMRHRACPYRLPEKINWCIEKSRAAYCVVPDPPTIMPRATPEEGAAITGALKTLASAGLGGASTHLLQAGERLNKGDYPDSVRESIHAVESVARKLDPEAKSGLAPALKALERHAAIHGGLRAGFSSIYGYTSDEDGIRHSMLKSGAQVDLEDAVFMLGACASFTSYLVGKARKAGLIAE